MTCLGHVSGTWHAGSVRFRDEASRQALTSLCTAALFSGLGPLGPSWNEDVEMETRGIVVREGAGGPRIAELEVAERACERLCSGLAREGAGWILGLKPETPLGHLYPRAAWGRGEDRWPLQTRGRGPLMPKYGGNISLDKYLNNPHGVRNGRMKFLHTYESQLFLHKSNSPQSSGGLTEST